MRSYPFSSRVLPGLSRPRPLAWAVLLILLLPSLAHAATFNVPSTLYPTIQSAITAAANGDTVLVAAGTYSGPGNRDIDFDGKNLTVTSQAGAGSTMIDCGGYVSTDGSGNHRGFYIHSGETSAVISGFTVKNGYETTVSGVADSGNGGGICGVNSNATIQNCTIAENSASSSGGGIFNSNSSTAIQNCTISGNTAQSSDGGGIYNANTGNTISVTNCTFTGNTACNGGGGICNEIRFNGMITVACCTFANNTVQVADGDGGGICNESSYSGIIALNNCVLTGNTAGYGGGIFNDTYNNGVSNTISVTNCTLTGNKSPSGGGISNYDQMGITATLTNNILYNDTGGEIADYKGSVSTSTASYSDVQGGYPGSGNINADPQFVNAAYGDLYLKAGSLCIKAGTATGAPTTDADGNPRPNPPSMGAYDTNAAVNLALPPVLLVHGTFSSATDAWSSGMSARLANEGFTVEAVNFPTEPETLSNETYIELQAQAIGRRVQELEDRTGQRHIDMVCHSMGGLAARYYLQHLDLWPVHLDQARQAGVDKLILLGTPNWGFDATILDPISTVTQAHLMTMPNSPDGYDSGAVDTYDNWSPAIKEQFAEWEPAPRDNGNGGYAYPNGYELWSWPTNLFGNYKTTINPVASYSFAEGEKTLWYPKYALNGFNSTDYQAVADVLSEFPLLPSTDQVHLDYYTQKAQQLGVMYPDGAQTAGVDGRLVSPFLKTLNTTPDNSGAKIYMIAGTFPVALQVDLAGPLNIGGPYAANLPNDGIVPTYSALGQDPITGVYVYPQAKRAMVNAGHTSLTSDPNVINQVVTWLKGTTVPNATHILWNKTDGTAAIFVAYPDATYSYHAFGPFPGWTAKAIADGPDGLTRILWTNTNGTAAIWILDTANWQYTYSESGPVPGWRAVAISIGGDGMTHLLWNATDGTASAGNVDTGTGRIMAHAEFGPYTGWTAKALASGATVTDLLWTKTDGTTAGWRVAADGNLTRQAFAPIPGWGASALSVGPDDIAHPLWDKNDGTASVWNADFLGDGIVHTEYAPTSGWSAVGVATGTDNVTHLLWDKTDGTASVYGLNADGSYSFAFYGPFAGWTAVGIAAP